MIAGRLSEPMGESKPKKRSKPAGSKPAMDGLSSTVGNFANRIQRKLKEQENLDEASARAAEQRHAAMLRALSTIRRALQETSKINLGKRFSLQFESGDWEGWPRLQLSLIDAVAPDRRDYSLIVSAHDRNECGLVELRMLSGQLLGKVELKQEGEYERIPLVMKKSVRTFLDQVAEYVLHPRKESELLEDASRPVETDALDEEAQRLKEINLFNDDDYGANENLVEEQDEAEPLQSISFEKQEK